MTKLLPAPKDNNGQVLPFSREAYHEKYPLHSCVDQPDLPCEACTKWAPKKKKSTSNRRRA